jgi:hypothetical protein
MLSSDFDLKAGIASLTTHAWELCFKIRAPGVTHSLSHVLTGKKKGRPGVLTGGLGATAARQGAPPRSSRPAAGRGGGARWPARTGVADDRGVRIRRRRALALVLGNEGGQRTVWGYGRVEEKRGSENRSGCNHLPAALPNLHSGAASVRLERKTKQSCVPRLLASDGRLEKVVSVSGVTRGGFI